MTTSEKKGRKPADKGIRPQYIDRRYDLVSRKWHWRVPSFTNATDVYTVHYNRTTRQWECTCGDHIHREHDCKHIDLVLMVMAREKELQAERRALREQKAATSLASVLPKPIVAAKGSLYSNQGFSLNR